MDGTLVSPSTDEFAFGLIKRLGTKGSLRGDVVYRKSNDFYATRVDMGTGTVSGSLAGVTRTFDKQIIVNTSEESREYWGFTLSAAYRFFQGLQLQGNWTWSRLRGTFDGENAASGSVRSSAPFYPEYRAAAWSRPVGDLGADQRHKVRLWAIYDLPFDVSWFKSSVSILQQFDTGTPYGAVGAVDTRPYVDEPWLPHPAVDRDLLLHRPRRSSGPTTSRGPTFPSTSASALAGSLEIFVEPQVLNVFNQQNVVDPCDHDPDPLQHRQRRLRGLQPLHRAAQAGPRRHGWRHADEQLELRLHLRQAFRRRQLPAPADLPRLGRPPLLTTAPRGPVPRVLVRPGLRAGAFFSSAFRISRAFPFPALDRSEPSSHT